MKEQYTKEEASKILAQQTEEFLANGGVITKVKTKKAPREFRGKAVKDGGRLGTMGPKMQANGNNGKTA